MNAAFQAASGWPSRLDPDRLCAAPPGRAVAERTGGDGTILVIGPPRSGTTWLAKIFDSHPDVLYRHEPDEGTDCLDPGVADRQALLASIVGRRDVRTVGKPPLFRKSYRSLPRHVARGALIHAFRLAGHAGRPGAWLGRMQLPDMLDRGGRAPPRLVVKSTRARGFARLLAGAVPGLRVVVIVRHPCGQVASRLRGAALGKFVSAHPIDDDIAAVFARARGETIAWGRLPLLDQCAWNWASFLDETFRELRGVDAVRVVRHEEICARPQAEARALFAFAGLAWDGQTERFIARSSHGQHRGGYYDLFRDSADVPGCWRSALTQAQQQRVTQIARQAGFGHFLGEPEEQGISAAAD